MMNVWSKTQAANSYPVAEMLPLPHWKRISKHSIEVMRVEAHKISKQESVSPKAIQKSHTQALRKREWANREERLTDVWTFSKYCVYILSSQAQRRDQYCTFTQAANTFKEKNVTRKKSFPPLFIILHCSLQLLCRVPQCLLWKENPYHRIAPCFAELLPGLSALLKG